MPVARATFAALAACAVVACALAACSPPPVVRVVDGRPEVGRFISEAAYAYFARGAQAEASGDLAVAARAFELAAVEDPESPEIWTHLGAVRCRAGAPARPVDGAAEAFARAEALDPSFGPLHRERARCSIARGEASAAVVEAELALALDPDDLDTALVRAEALADAGRADDARRAWRAILARRPTSHAAWIGLLDLARRTGDAALTREASDRASALAPAIGASRSAGVATVDAAIRSGDLGEARRRATKARLAGGELALRAAALGRAAMAREQAELVLGADPADASARIALAAAADLSGDVAALEGAMRKIPARSTAPSPLGRLLFAEVLARRVDTAAARAWLGPPRDDAPTADDPVLAATRDRVRNALEH